VEMVVKKVETWRNMRPLAVNLRENVEIAARLVIKWFNVRRNQTTMAEIMETQLDKVITLRVQEICFLKLNSGSDKITNPV
jgi:hypothetical protein